MPGQFKKPHYPYNGEELENIGVLQMRGESLENKINVETHSGDVINDVDGRFDKVTLIWG